LTSLDGHHRLVTLGCREDQFSTNLVI